MESAVPLAPRTTLELGGSARYWLTVDRDALVAEALHYAHGHEMAVAILGGGSNLVVSDAGFDGLVLGMAQRGTHVRELPDGRVAIEAAAGEAWDDVVALSVDRGLSGIECLSGIPGTVGATPIQNVGAYGQEVADTIAAVTVFERDSGVTRVLTPKDCGFAYRDSRFKREPERFVVLTVTYVLRAGSRFEPTYAELRRALAVRSSDPTPAEVREVVLGLRRAKSMVIDRADENRRSVGSFFMNPVLSAARAQELIEGAVARGLVPTASDVPTYPQADGRVKLAAAWLLERAGVRKGEREGAFGISSRHALAIVHHGGGRSEELVRYARGLRARVSAQFGIELAVEPVFLGFAPGSAL